MTCNMVFMYMYTCCLVFISEDNKSGAIICDHLSARVRRVGL